MLESQTKLNCLYRAILESENYYMINTNLPSKNITLYEVIKYSNNDRDIADTIYDWAVYFDCPIGEELSECKDSYDRAMLLLALNIEVESTNDSYIICKVADFISKFRKQIDRFFNIVHKEEYKPKNMEYIEDESEDFYDFYMTCFESFISGGYSDNDYKIFYDCMFRG